MATFHIQNFGCRATSADAAAIEQQFRDGGFARCGDAHVADVLVLNTCTVTAAADAQARDAIRHAHRRNPGAHIVVTGCYAQRAPQELAALPGVSLVVGNSHQSQIAQVAQTFLSARVAPVGGQPGMSAPPLLQIAGDDSQALHSARAKILTGDIFEFRGTLAPVSFDDADRTRPILKIQDGCNSRCAYCVIPYVRGRSRSLPPRDVIAEIRRLCEAGAREVVLSGINLGSYGRDLTPRADFGDLLRQILEETQLERLRVSSIEPMDVSQDLVELIAAWLRIARHFHMPLQSGSDRMLAAMHRWYRAAHYAERVKLIHRLLPGAAIGADVIAGFPGESGEDHAATLRFIEELPFTYLHVFSFSARPGTEAARLLERRQAAAVAPHIIRQRARELRALGSQKAAAFRESQRRETLRALTLRTQGGDSRGPWTEALTGNYLKLRLPGRHPANQWHLASLDACNLG